MFLAQTPPCNAKYCFGSTSMGPQGLPCTGYCSNILSYILSNILKCIPRHLENKISKSVK